MKRKFSSPEEELNLNLLRTVGLLGKPVYTDPAVAGVAVSARSVLFGDFSRYFVRQVKDIRFERSDDYAFNADLATFKCVLRGDGGLADQSGAIKAFVGNAA